jgi:hypothetical protein
MATIQARAQQLRRHRQVVVATSTLVGVLAVGTVAAQARFGDEGPDALVADPATTPASSSASITPSPSAPAPSAAEAGSASAGPTQTVVVLFHHGACISSVPVER